MPSPVDLVLASVFAVLVLIGVVGNVLVCLVILRFSSMRTPMNYLLLNLAAADLLTLLFVSPQYVFIHTFVHPIGRAGDIICKLLTGGNISWIGGVASVFALVSIAFERYYAVIHPQSQGRISKRSLWITVVSCWLFSLLFNAPLFYVIHYDSEMKFCMESWPNAVLAQINSTCWFVMIGLIPVTIMVGLYSKVIYSLWIKKEESADNTQLGTKRVRKKVTKTVLTVSIIYTLCWFPQLSIYMLSYVGSDNEFGGVSYIITVALVTVNSVVNPIIYSLQSGKFRKCLKVVLCRNQRRVEDSGVRGPGDVAAAGGNSKATPSRANMCQYELK
ncbi:galanin receptor 2a [Nematostella vectensis]|uniref:galanin receptor 2a n=1 Tax=Nematostella vectensis TaxID=45351 RepID=UPI00138FDB78|nr:galanin receptor 2a [Nematostella vectensis]XP_048581325.1 galanin receptor 2a [Nematostella vectensis]